MKKPEKKGESQKSKLSRRDFIGTTAATAAAFMIVPRHVLGGPGYVAPSDKLDIICVGCGGKGTSDTTSVSTENIVALVDVDDEKMQSLKDDWTKNRPELLPKFEKAKKYRDFRAAFEKEKFDAVTVSIPDHSHAVVAMMALKMKKHVFCQKPLTHTIYEARMLAEEAKKAGVATQMGNQGHASEEARLINEWIWDGAIGKVREVHCWTNRPIWPQGMEAPQETPSCPPTLDWNIWLGPAKWRPYHPSYCHFVWRGWRDFGTGAVGDMGAHIIDHPYWALKLGHPKTVQASSTKFTDASYPQASIVTYIFPERDENFPEVKFVWYDGGLTPPRPEELEPKRKMGIWDGGILFYGEKGKLMCGTYGKNPRLIPETKMKEYKRPAKTIPRSPGIHEEWIEAAKTGKKSTTDFSYSGPLTETMLLGGVATLMQFENVILEWDPEKMEITNLPEANKFLHMEYRDGWSL
ncbi:Gfo/Idh/MocA family oxidoreductase [candidate division KSB1 bacterium]|nr:Gfo/Idh/MocA family oxidoreductase [candidate division KSB1 bacterium]